MITLLDKFLMNVYNVVVWYLNKLLSVLVIET